MIKYIFHHALMDVLVHVHAHAHVLQGIDILAVVLPHMCMRHPNVRFIIGGDGPKRKLLQKVRVRVCACACDLQPFPSPSPAACTPYHHQATIKAHHRSI